MNDILSLINIDKYYGLVLLIDLAVAFVILANVKIISGIISNVNATKELAEKDNPAFGISLAGVALGITIMLSGVMSGEASATLQREFYLVACYGILGIVLMSLTRFIFDKVSITRLSIRDEILASNMAAGLLDAGNVVATAVIVRAVIMWVESDTLTGLAMIIGGYILSQLILTLASLYRLHIHKKLNKTSIEAAVKDGNMAVAWRFTGYRIGVALAITAASGFVSYAGFNMMTASLWLLVSLVMMLLVTLLSWLSDKVILSGIDVRDEVDKQNNIAIGVIQCVTTIAIGVIIMVLAN